MSEVAAGNRLAFAVLSRRHLRRSLGLARRVVGNAHDAEEVVQECFLQVWRHASGWRGDGTKFSTWLYRIVINRAISYRRKQRFAPLEEAMDVVDPDPDAATVTESRDMARAVDTIIAGLPERQRLALGLCYYNEMSCAEAAEAMGVTVSSMESLLVRARRTVRAKLEQAGRMPTGRSKEAKAP